ncbi:MAG: hypothetical protein SF069_17940 [Phycisphaerae bacterium]|nr:hypothetical protein [Phycisphaerae bacterium]
MWTLSGGAPRRGAAVIGLLMALLGPTPAAIAQCFDDGCSGQWPNTGSQEYVLGGSDVFGQAYSADDQANVCVNNQRVQCDSDIFAGNITSVRFRANPGDMLKVTAFDYFGGCRSRGALWLHSPDGCKIKIADAIDDGCNRWPARTVFNTVTYSLPDWRTFDGDGDGRRDCGPPAQLSLRVERTLRVPSNFDPNTTFRDQLVDVRLVVTNEGDEDIDAVVAADVEGIPDGASEAPGRRLIEPVSGPTPAMVAVPAGGTGTISFVYRCRQGGKLRIRATAFDFAESSNFATDESDPFTIAAVEIAKVEPVQVLYDVPMVGRKPTKLKLTLRNAADFDINARLRFTIRSLSLAQDGGPYVYETQDIAVKGRLFQSDPPRETVVFWPPDQSYIDKFLGRAQLDSEVINEGASPVQDEVIEQEVDVRVIKPLKIGLISIIGDGSQVNVGLLRGIKTQLPAAIERVLPCANTEVFVSADNVYGGLLSAGGASLRALDRMRRLGGYDAVAGVLGPNESLSPGGSYNVAPGSYRAYYMSSSSLNLNQSAHDIGHCFGLPLAPVRCGTFTLTAIDEYCPDGNPAEQTAAPGYDVRAGKEVAEARKNVMSSEATLANNDAFWINDPSYQHMLSQLEAFGRDPECFLVSGVIAANGTVTPDSWYTFFTPAPDEATSGATWFVDQVDAGGAVLSSFGLNLVRAPLPGDPSQGQDEFIATIAKSAGVAKLVLRGPAGTALERALNGAPIVSQISPTGGETLSAATAVTVSWTASDPEGDPLTFTVLYSFDDGANWTPLIADTTATSATWNIPDDATRAARIRVIASDGLNTGEYQSRRFVVSGASEAALTASAGSDQDALVNTLVTLNGAASRDAADLEKAMIFEWSIAGAPSDAPIALSDANDPRPSFTPPVPGLYLFELVVRIGEERSAPDTVAIRVSEAGTALTSAPRNIVGGDDGPLTALVATDEEEPAPMGCGAACGASPLGALLALAFLKSGRSGFLRRSRR